MNNMIDLMDQKFGKLYVLRKAKGINTRTAYWLCQCDCGSDPIIVRSDHLRSNETKSCGCLRIEKPMALRHGKSNTSEYQAWADMKRRCNNPNYKDYKNYGARGIKVSEKFIGINGFENWFAEIGPKPGPEYSQDRINNNGNYEPGNIRWATWEIQANNRRERAIG